MSTLEKGNQLEDNFYAYLCAQKERGELVYGAYPPELCKIYKKKKYFCKEREADVEFDIIIEFTREGSSEPHLYIIFECKNYSGSVPEDKITDFSDKINRIFGHSGKGAVVLSSRLQSGAHRLAENRKIAIIKFDKLGLNVLAERRSGIRTEKKFLERQFFVAESQVRSLKFSAYHDGVFFSSLDGLLDSLDPSGVADKRSDYVNTVPFLSNDEIQRSAQSLLELIGYEDGPVDLAKICSKLSLDLVFEDNIVYGDFSILGYADFDQKIIRIFSHESHENRYRERFTIGHEIGHFFLGHSRFLRSECIVEPDLSEANFSKSDFSFDRLEFQANVFAAQLLLPVESFKAQIVRLRENLGIRDIGHGYIFVDDQSCNYGPYHQLISSLSSEFEVSRKTVEIQLKKDGLVTDKRKNSALYPNFLTPFFGSKIQSD